jgi:hypothetical protein
MSERVPTSAPPTLLSSGLYDRRALVVDPNRKKLRAIERVLKSVIATVEVRETLESPPDDGDFDLIALTYDPLSPELRAQWTARFGGTSRTRLMLLSSGHWDSSHRALLDQRRLTHLLATQGDELDGDQLLVTTTKIVARDIFGLEKYFPWGSGLVRGSVARSGDIGRLVNHARDFARNLGVNDRLGMAFASVTDEFLSNALYNAPVDTTGQRLYAHLDRTVPVRLEPDHVIDVAFCSDGRKIGVSVTDPFGSLASDTVQTYLAKCLRREVDQVDTKAGGAGLGLYQAFGSVSHLVLNLSRGRRCEFIGLIDVRGTFKDFVAQAKSFNIFVE